MDHHSKIAISGVLILLLPRSQRYIVALYLIAVGVIGLLAGAGIRLG